MRDYDMIIHEFLGGHDIEIVPVFDVHLGNPYCMEQEFMEFIKETAETPNRYLIIGGDLIENGTRSSVGDSVFQQTMPPWEQKKLAANILAPVRDRCLCFLQGNHEARSMKDAASCPMLEIAAKLDLEDLYRENIAFIDIQLGIRKNADGKRTYSAMRPDYMLLATHGSGGGMLTGSSLNRNERLMSVIDGGLDVLVTGHVHKAFSSFPEKIVIDRHNKTISTKKNCEVSSASWLKYGGYAAKKMLLPASHVIQILHLSGKKKNMSVTAVL